MSELYDKMWEEMGIDLKAHYSVLQGLGKIFPKVFHGGNNRPQKMDYFDRCVHDLHGGRIAEIQELRSQGKKVVGIFCVFVPDELTFAADAIQVGLCAGAPVGYELAEKYLPRNTCALVKSFFGFKLSGTSPYMQIADMVVGETTCDQKKKSYEIMNEFYPIYLMEIPQRKESCDRVLWKEEILRFKNRLEELTGNRITTDNLKEGIKIINNRRRALQRLNKIRENPLPVISGIDVLLINQLSFSDDPHRFTEHVHQLCDELEERIKDNIGIAEPGAPRILMAGCPMAMPNWKIPAMLEKLGAVIVGEEACVGSRHTRDLVDESRETPDEMIDAIAHRYLGIDCACFTPNSDRLENIIEQAKALKVDGIINYNLSFCQPYLIESWKVEQAADNNGIPILSIETDYGMEDKGQLQTRIEAFLEMLR